MPKRLSIVALFVAWLCASGAMLDTVQGFVWARMFVRYAGTMPVAQAAVETMDPGKPCALCLAVRRAREESKREQPASVTADATKIVLILDEIEPVVFAPGVETWPETTEPTLPSWRSPVPVPPPRTGAAAVNV